MKIKHLSIVLLFGLIGCNGEEGQKTYNNSKLGITAKVESRSLTDFNGNGKAMGLTVTKGDATDEDYPGGGKLSASFTDGIWKLDKSVTIEEPAHVYAFHPDAAVKEGEIPIRIGTDYLYAENGAVATAAKPEVELIMKHAMTYLGINIKKGSYQGQGELQEVTVKSANQDYHYTGEPQYYSEGFMNIATGDIRTEEHDWTKNYINYSHTCSHIISKDGWEDIEAPGIPMLPFKIYNEGYLLFQYKVDNKTFAFEVPMMEFEKGKKYIFDITLSVVDAVAVRCVDWEVSHMDMGENIVRPEGLKYQETVYADNLTTSVPDMGNVDAVVDWGDGHTDKYYVSLEHTYAQAGTYTISIKTWNSSNDVTISISNRNFIDFIGETTPVH